MVLTTHIIKIFDKELNRPLYVYKRGWTTDINYATHFSLDKAKARAKELKNKNELQIIEIKIKDDRIIQEIPLQLR